MTAALFGLFVSGFCARGAIDAAGRGDVAWTWALALLSFANLIIGALNARGAAQ